MKSNYDANTEHLVKAELARCGVGPGMGIQVLHPSDLKKYTTLAKTVGTTSHFTDTLISQLEKRGITHVYILACVSTREICTMIIPKLPRPLGHVIENSVNKNGGGLRYEHASIDGMGQNLVAFFESE